MKLLVLHLSDIHFCLDRSFALARIDQIVAAALNVEIAFDTALLVFSGDIANTGKGAEYDLAKRFINDLKVRIHSAVSATLPIELIVVPGNHDLDFSVTGEDLTDVLAADVVRTAREPSTSAGIYNTLLKAQDDFSRFQQEVTGRVRDGIAERLYEDFAIQVGSQKVLVTGLNTAVLSRRREVQGSLWYPMEVLDRPHEIGNGNSFSILTYHHPDKWLESNNAVRFRSFTDAFSDLVLIGHQHTADSFYSESLAGDKSWYSAGDALQGSSENKSGFNVICLDFELSMRRRVAFTWNRDFYLASEDTGWRPFFSNANARAGYVISDKFNDILDNPGNLITHGQKKKVFLNDVYEPCRLRIRNSNLSKTTSVISASELPAIAENNSPILIFGDAQSGKTVLCKHLFRQLFNASGTSVPLILHGENLKGSAEKDIDRWVRKSFQSTYTLPTMPKFKALDRACRILIVDDWQNVPLNDIGKALVVEQLQKWSSRVILIADSWYQLEELASTTEDNAYSSTFVTLNILPYAPWQQTNMIERWITLGREETLSRNDKIYEIDQAEKHLDELTATGVLPKYPLHILTALQTFQALQESEPDMGAQGHLYDTLVERAVKAMSEDAPGMGINRQFISLLAGAAFDREQAPLTVEQIQRIADDYLLTHAVRVEISPLLDLLVVFRLLRLEDGGYSFRERYIYYYFVAEFFVLKLNRRADRDAALKKLKEMAQYLAFEEYAQILMFVIYKNQNEDLIDEIILNSHMIFEGVRNCDLATDVEFINKLNITRPQVSLASENIEDNRMEQRKSLGEEAPEPYARELNKSKYSPDLSEGAKLQHAFKAMQMMGRILRNFPGNLEATTKLNLASSTYELGLRTLTKLFDGIKEELPAAQSAIRQAIKAKTNKFDEMQLDRRADEMLTYIITGCAIVVITSVSSAVGSPKLRETYRGMHGMLQHTAATILISLAVELEQFREVPVKSLEELKTLLETNHVAFQALRYLVWRRVMYLPLESHKLKQQLCESFEITAKRAPVLPPAAS